MSEVESLKGPRSIAPPIPAALIDIAMIDGATCAAVGDMGLSWWLDEVRAGRAPQPVVREARCTRWDVSEVRAFWIKRRELAKADGQASARISARAKKASDAAQAKRKATSGKAVPA